MKRIAICTSLILVLIFTACNQNTIAALVSTLGNASSALASLLNKPDLAAKIRQDAQQASADVLAWKQGSDSQMALQALHLLENDVNLICQSIPGQPGADCQKYEPLIALALGTADTIISILQPTQKAMARPQMAGAPKTAKEFTKRWNALAKQQGLSQAVIQ